MKHVLILSIIITLSYLITLSHANLEYLKRERNLEQSILAQRDKTTKQQLFEVPEYKADSGGCAPLVNHANEVKDGKWFEWQKRLDKLNAKLDGDKAKKMKQMFTALDKNIWMQYIDGWTHPKGKDSFGAFYIRDLNKARDYTMSMFGKKNWLNVDVYTEIHNLAFVQDAKRLEKRNGYRHENSGVYLPLPDKPLGVFHDIQEHGKMTYDPKLRMIDTSPAQNKKGRVWKYNGGYLYRWRYPGVTEEQGRKIVQDYMDEAWKAIDGAGENDVETKFKAVVKLYHQLENFHCFIDGNGRTNYMVLQAMLCEIGLHPVLLYNLMESALSSVEEEYDRVIEGFLKWETAYSTGESGWTIPEIEARSKDCETAIAELYGKKETTNFVPDTLSGCMCEDVKSCDSNPLRRGKKWCKADGNCTFPWDYCAPGRSSIKPK